MADAVEQTEEATDDGLRSPDGATAPTARLICIDPSVLAEGAATTIDLCGDTFTVGRAGDNSAALKVKGVSRRHARLVWDGGQWTIEDLGSTNGVRVNRKKVSSQRLQAGDVVQLGRARFEFRPCGDAADQDKLAAVDIGDSTVVIRPEIKSFDAYGSISRRSQPLAGQRPHPRTAANLSPAPAQPGKGRRRRGKSDRWLWWLAAGVVVILALGYNAL